ncbi:MAG: ergothioneine biosynthesis protein EgtB [Planctomycetes bacterium]|nr:ergothioneine biosynthesis protein EgtB [Planctomycetota bacterium]
MAPPSALELVVLLRDARRRLLACVEDLSDAELRVPQLAIVNPFAWELGHVAWFQERWNLRHRAGRSALRADADELFDSSAVAHDTRWELRLPERGELLAYLAGTLDATCARLAAARDALDPLDAYFAQLALFHEDMHVEALLYTRQTLGLRRPRGALGPESDEAEANAGPLAGDVEIPGAAFQMGAERDGTFVFDNELDAHAATVATFRIARAAVTQGEFAEFVEARGYGRRELWSDAGWAWRVASAARQPVYWLRESNGRWLRRRFDRWVALAEHRPVLHVNAFEAEAYCRWRGRRLPSEAEWEHAARGAERRLFPWGTAAPEARHANLSARAGDVADVGAHADGDSAFGCRQMLGNTWEWTASAFAPYPGFVAGPYTDYSAPWFGTHRVLRGGAFVTQARLIRASWRNFYTPDRRDVWSGFRTVAT